MLHNFDQVYKYTANKIHKYSRRKYCWCTQKMRNDYGAILLYIFRYCDSKSCVSIYLFLSFLLWLIDSFLYFSPYNYRSSIYGDNSIYHSFTLLKASAKINGYISLSPLRASGKSVNYRESNEEEKQRTDNKN